MTTPPSSTPPTNSSRPRPPSSWSEAAKYLVGGCLGVLVILGLVFVFMLIVAFIMAI